MRGWRRHWRGVATALAVPPVLTAVLTNMSERLNMSSQVLIYLVVVVAIARLGGMFSALVAAIWASLLLNYYFISPVHTFRIAVANDVIALFAFVVVAITVASVVEYSGKLSRQAALADAEAAKLEAADKMRTALLAAVSHDLRSPLSAARTVVDTLRDPQFDLSDEDRTELLGAAHTSLERLSRLVEDLLDMSRLQAGALKPHLEPVAPQEVVARAVDDVPGAIGRVRVAPLPDRTPPMVADLALLERVLVNLVGNAIKHTDSAVEIVIETDPDEVRLLIIDHGSGIPAEDRDRVFRPFQRLGDRDNTAGVGLGLALSRGLTEAMGGTLLPQDSAGGGLTMVVTLPAAALPEDGEDAEL
jgi:two-component system sensor histidine kinase KdpD